jgi:hypothetical protein
MPAISNVTATWNNAGITYNGIKLNVTDTASNTASLLLDLQVGGVSKFKVSKAGVVTPAASIELAANMWVRWVGAYIDESLSAARFNGNWLVRNGTVFQFGPSIPLGWGSNDSAITANDLLLSRKAAASLQLGAADAAAPVAQTIGPQSVVAGTADTAGAAFTIRGSQGTGTGAGGSIVLQVAPAGTTASTQNALATALTIDSTKLATFTGPVRPLTTTVAALPAAAAGMQGARAMVTDANAATFGTTAAAGGANIVPVWCDGTVWKIG